jgi:hypothetical protein
MNLPSLLEAPPNTFRKVGDVWFTRQMMDSPERRGKILKTSATSAFREFIAHQTILEFQVPTIEAVADRETSISHAAGSRGQPPLEKKTHEDLVHEHDSKDRPEELQPLGRQSTIVMQRLKRVRDRDLCRPQGDGLVDADILEQPSEAVSYAL